MHVLGVRNVNDALPLGLRLLRDHGERRDSRNGGVRSMPMPTTTVYGEPTERVIFDPVRDANPFFHLFESIWMLAGKNDLAYVTRFAKNMENYSDDGLTMWGAYGWRWRSFFDEFDQIRWAIRRLSDSAQDRRVVVTMWSPTHDTKRADEGGKDVPCNTQLYLSINSAGKLDMTVCNRSNDVIWGAYGANAVHMSMLQEYVAGQIGCKVGRYWQMSNNYHAYDDLYDKLLPGAESWDPFEGCPYTNKMVERYAMFNSAGVGPVWDMDLHMFMEEPTALGFKNAFFRKILVPMWCAHEAYKEKDFEAASELLMQMPERNDWRMAATQWLQRRVK